MTWSVFHSQNLGLNNEHAVTEAASESNFAMFRIFYGSLLSNRSISQLILSFVI
jgi:hypothetical protein